MCSSLDYCLATDRKTTRCSDYCLGMDGGLDAHSIIFLKYIKYSDPTPFPLAVLYVCIGNRIGVFIDELLFSGGTAAFLFIKSWHVPIDATKMKAKL